METFSALLAICAGNSPVPGEFPAQRPVTRSFDVSFDLHPNKRLSKQWWGWWFETPSCPLWRHPNVISFGKPTLQVCETKPRALNSMIIKSWLFQAQYTPWLLQQWRRMSTIVSQIPDKSTVCSTAYLNWQFMFRILVGPSWRDWIHRSPMGFPAQMASNTERISMLWHHREVCETTKSRVLNFMVTKSLLF